MTIDLVERLEARATFAQGTTDAPCADASLLREAAAELRRLRSERACVRAETIEEAARTIETSAASLQASHDAELRNERYEPVDREICEGRIKGLKRAARIVRLLSGPASTRGNE